MSMGDTFRAALASISRLSRAWRLMLGGSMVAVLGFSAFLLHVGAERDRLDPIWERIQRAGVIRVGMEASFPPFEVTNEAGEFDGYDVDLAQELARRLGVQARFVNIHFDGLYDALYDGKIDIIISALPFERDRTRDVCYTVPYFHAGQVLVAMTGSEGIEGVEDLADKTVAVEMGSEAHYLVRQLVSRQAVPVTVLTAYTSDEALDMVIAGDADAAIADAVTVYSYLPAHPELRPIGEQLTDEPYVIATPLEGRTLVDEINRALADMDADGFMAALLARWFGG